MVRNADGVVEKIVEEKDADGEIKKIQEVNSSIYTFKSKPLFEALQKLAPSNAQGEYYLTDVISILSKKGEKVTAFQIDDEEEIIGINSQETLSRVNELAQNRGL